VCTWRNGWEAGRQKEIKVEITLEKVGDVTVVTPRVEALDASNSKQFSQKVTEQVAPGDKVVLELSRVRFVDSAGCGALITCIRHLRSGGGDLKLCGITKQVRMLFELVRLHNLLDILNTREEAVKTFQV
jgi:anti-sigma B factor antagonist